MTFPSPGRRTPQQEKIAQVVNDSVFAAIEKFCDRIYDRLSSEEVESEDLKQAINSLAPDFADDWEEYFHDNS